MRPRILTLGLAVLGVGLVLSALVLSSYNNGSCRELPANNSYTFPMFGLGHSVCDHMMTLGGVTFWIGTTSGEIAIVGALVLASSLAVFLYGVMNNKTPVTSDFAGQELK